ncbi:MAG: DUF3791 domain-containing protein [Oscillospiraceae bacterium]|nr:DUF3791 domain-containing protein [Oscillospiraceae bacterium]
MHKLSEEMDFFIFLLDNYAVHTNRHAGDILQEWDDKGITQEIYDMYFQYHQERLENAYEDIESLMATGKHIDR